jgi:hypothetical protein
MVVAAVLVTASVITFGHHDRNPTEPYSASERMKGEYDEKIRQAKLQLARLATDYLTALRQLEDSWARYQHGQHDEKLNFLCTLQYADCGDCPRPDPREVLRYKQEVQRAANELRRGWVVFQSQVRQIQSEYRRSLGLLAPLPADPREAASALAKLPPSELDQTIEKAVARLL